MTPLFFDTCFGWLHEAATVPAAAGEARQPALGVVLCGAFAQEEICTRHGQMALAEQLAAAGMPTLRFDYRGTGDSAEADRSIAAYEDTIVRAVDCLRQSTGVGPVALCGLRLGSALAVRAALRIENVAGIVMLAPVISGQAFLREMRAAASVANLAIVEPVPAAKTGLPLNTNGFAWSGALQQEVGAIDLMGVARSAPQMLFATVRADRRAAAFAEAMHDKGVKVREQPFADYDAYMRDPTTHETPVKTFAAVEAWLTALPRGDAPLSAVAPVMIEPSLVQGDMEEVPVRFGPGDKVFGILCRPLGRPAAPVAALLLPEGSSHHIGNGGAYVRLARRLARAGIASLRMDLTGIGDSPAGTNNRNPHYDPERLVEVVAGLDLLEQQGFARAATFGLCAGAHTAYQAGLMDTRVVGIIIINLQKFVWHYGDDIRVAATGMKRSVRSYIRSMRNIGQWKRALSGDGDLIGIATTLTKRGLSQSAHMVRGLFPPAPGSEVSIVREQLTRLAERRVHTHLFFSDEDPGLAEMMMHFGHRARRLRHFAPARMTVLDKADHHFNASTARDRYIDAVEAAMHEVIAEHTSPVEAVASRVVPGAAFRLQSVSALVG